MLAPSSQLRQPHAPSIKISLAIIAFVNSFSLQMGSSALVTIYIQAIMDNAFALMDTILMEAVAATVVQLCAAPATQEMHLTVRIIALDST